MASDYVESDWHEGERIMHRLLAVPYGPNPTAAGLPARYGLWMSQCPVLALGTADEHDRIWTTVLGGEEGVILPIAESQLAFVSHARLTPSTAKEEAGMLDPVLDALFSVGGNSAAHGLSNEESPTFIDHAATGKLVAGLAIHLEQRMRIKLAGRMRRGALVAKRPKQGEHDGGSAFDVQMAVVVQEALGNCPKYLNRKAVWAHDPSPELVSDQLPLHPDAAALIRRADLFFMTSRYGDESMDTNIRGGAPGFVRVERDSLTDGVTLIYPEYSGNRLYQSLGNIKTDPKVGIVFPDFETGEVLYISGRADILIGEDAASVLPHSKLAVRIRIDALRFVRDGLYFRGRGIDQSPYNPPVWRLSQEAVGLDQASAEMDAAGRTEGLGTARLIRKLPISPTISRYTFSFSPSVQLSRSLATSSNANPWVAGQSVVLDFSEWLDRGWSHMRDNDPQSLNDDYVRSFTISSEPARRWSDGSYVFDPKNRSAEIEFEITARHHGPVTSLLSRWQHGSALSAKVLAFGGGKDVVYAIDPIDGAGELVFVAAGVGITPLMAQARELLGSRQGIKVLWSLRAEDLPLAIDVLAGIEGFAPVTALFVTGLIDDDQRRDMETISNLGTHVREGRVTKADVVNTRTVGKQRFYVCTPIPMRTEVLEWLADKDVRWESFDY